MSRFDRVLDSRQSRIAEMQKSNMLKPEKVAGQEPHAPTVRVGRPRAKRSNPDFQQVTAYIRKATYTATRKRLFDDGQEFSELVEELLEKWLRTPKPLDSISSGMRDPGMNRELDTFMKKNPKATDQEVGEHMAQKYPGYTASAFADWAAGRR